MSMIISVGIYVLFIAVSTFLPIFSFEGYSVFSNTTSHLGAQSSPHGWIMNIVFMLLGIRSMHICLKTRIPYIQFIGTIFATSLILTGLFKHGPLVDGVPINLQEDMLHSVFATATGFSFSLLAIGQGIMSRSSQRIVSLAVSSIALVIPLLMVSYPSYAGISQRFMFISAFFWLFFCFQPDASYKLKGRP